MFRCRERCRLREFGEGDGLGGVVDAVGAAAGRKRGVVGQAREGAADAAGALLTMV